MCALHGLAQLSYNHLGQLCVLRSATKKLHSPKHA